MEPASRSGKIVTPHNAYILRFAALPVLDRGNGVKSTPLVNPSVGSQHLAIGTTSFEPGCAIALHTHNCDESVCVIEGHALCEVDGEKHEMRPYDTTFVPAGIPHRFVNAGDTVMRIYFVYASGNVTRTFVETGETVAVQSAQDKASLPRE